MQHLFTFLAPRKLDRKTLKLFFRSSDRLVGVSGVQAQIFPQYYPDTEIHHYTHNPDLMITKIN